MQALDRSGWVCSEKDIILLENEIRQGEMYIQQAKDLQAAARSRGGGQEEDDGGKAYDDAASVASSADGKQYEVSGLLSKPLSNLSEEQEGSDEEISEGQSKENGQAFEWEKSVERSESRMSDETKTSARSEELVGDSQPQSHRSPGNFPRNSPSDLDLE